MYQYPFKKYVLGTRYGVKGRMWSCGYHSGLDLKSRNYGGDGIIFPVTSGIVESINSHGSSYGNHVVVKHDGYLSLYAHLASIYVKKGQSVNLNTKLGKEGTTGNSSGIHLHLEIHKGSYDYPSKIDPKKWLDERMEEDDMTEEEVRRIIKEVMTGSGNTPSTWAKAEWDKGKTLGITDGTRPQGLLTREQGVAMIVRALNK